MLEERDLVVTAGEDGRLITWRLGPGRQMRSEQTNGGSAVWSIEVQGKKAYSLKIISQGLLGKPLLKMNFLNFFSSVLFYFRYVSNFFELVSL